MTRDPKVKRLKSVMSRKMLSVYNQENQADQQREAVYARSRPRELKLPRVLVYKGGNRARAGNLKAIAFESAQQSDMSLLLHSAMQREFRGDPALYKDNRNITPGRGSSYQSGLRNIANENFKKKAKKKLLDFV